VVIAQTTKYSAQKIWSHRTFLWLGIALVVKSNSMAAMAVLMV